MTEKGTSFEEQGAAIKAVLTKNVLSLRGREARELRSRAIETIESLATCSSPAVAETFKRYVSDLESGEAIMGFANSPDMPPAAITFTERVIAKAAAECGKPNAKSLTIINASPKSSNMTNPQSIPIYVLHEIGAHYQRWLDGTRIYKDRVAEDTEAVILTAHLYAELRENEEIPESPFYESLLEYEQDHGGEKLHHKVHEIVEKWYQKRGRGEE